jgi:hypothetical protein
MPAIPCSNSQPPAPWAAYTGLHLVDACQCGPSTLLISSSDHTRRIEVLPTCGGCFTH